MANPRGSPNRSFTGRWSDTRLPSGKSEAPQAVPRISETLGQTAHGQDKSGTASSNQIIWITQYLTGAAVGINYVFQLQAITETVPNDLIRFTTSDELPDGVTMNELGQFEGTPSGGSDGSYPLIITALIPNQTAIPPIERNFTLLVGFAPAPAGGEIIITSDTELPPQQIGLHYKFQFQGAGDAAVTWSVHPDSVLPDGDFLDESGLFFGTATIPGEYSFKINADDGINTTATETFTIKVHEQQQGQIVITISNPLPNAVEGEIYAVQLTYTGNTSPVTFTVDPDDVPAGLSLGIGGLFSGVPEDGSANDYSIPVTCDSPTDLPAEVTFSLHISPAKVVITPAVIPDFTAGEDLELEWSITDPLNFTPDFHLYAFVDGSNVGEITALGTPTETSPGEWEFTATIPTSFPATDAITVGIFESVSGTFAFTEVFEILAYPTITFDNPSLLTSGSVGHAYTELMVAIGGLATVTFTSVGDPPGLAMDSAGAWTGSPITSGNYTVAITATDGIGPDVTQNFTIYIEAAGEITITSESPLPQGTVGIPYSQQLTATGNVGAITWSEGAGFAPGIPIDSSGLIDGIPTLSGVYVWTVTASDGIATNGTKQFTLIINPSLGRATGYMVARDGTTLLYAEGVDADIVNGSVGNPDLTVAPYYSASRPINLAALSDNYPSGGLGLHIKMTSTMSWVRNRGFRARFGAVSATSGDPFYWQSHGVSIPGRTIPYAVEYRGATDNGGGSFTLATPGMAKHPCLTASVTTTKYVPSRSWHMLDGGESIHYTFTTIGDENEASLVPGAGALADAEAVADINTSMLSAYPYLEHLVDTVGRHDATTYNNPLLYGANQQGATSTWCTKVENWWATFGPGNFGNQPLNPYHSWYSGMYVMIPDVTGNMLKPCWYGSELWLFINYLRNPSDTDTLSYALQILRRKIQSGLHASDAAGTYKNHWVDESATATNFNGTWQLHKIGTAGVYFPSFAKMWDLGLVLGYLLRPDDELIADAFNRRTATLSTVAENYVTGPCAKAAGNSWRSPAHYLRSLWWYFQAHTLLGNAATAALLKARAVAFIEQMFVTQDQSATCPAAMGVPTKALWPTNTSHPTVTPLETSFAKHGISEGFHYIISKWMVEENTNPTRLDFWKLMCVWYFTYCTRRYTGGGFQNRREVMYQIYIDMTGGGATWNNAPAVYSTSTAPAGVGSPSYNHTFEHSAWFLGMEEYMTAWYPGAVAPDGLTWAAFFTEFSNMGYQLPNPDWPGIGLTTSWGNRSGNGSLNYDIWAEKTINIWRIGALHY